MIDLSIGRAAGPDPDTILSTETGLSILAFSPRGAAATVVVLFLPEPDTVRCKATGPELAFNLLAATACIAEPSIDFPINLGRSIVVGRGIRLVGSFFPMDSGFNGSLSGFFSSDSFLMATPGSVGVVAF
jgi:hypothetical protein